MADQDQLRTDALAFHKEGRPGKLEIRPTKALTTQRDLSLAYSPGVAIPCEEIAANPECAYDYTAKGNTVAVISNGTAVLGLGNLGALASKPVMEGKAVLFKRFADVDGIDLELDTEDVDEFVNAVKLLAPTFGGINLEDIAAPAAFEIEARLKELCDIPVMHDDQHGTAIIAAAGLINSLHITGRELKDTKLVALGAGAASIATVELLKAMGMPHGNVTMVDSKGVIYQGRTQSMNQWKSAHAIETDARTLDDALKGADVFFGLARANAVSKAQIDSMADRPIVFAMANPTPEILPEDVKAVRPDAIVATGRSDYPNQVNNVLGFPYIFRGALDVRSAAITTEMKIAAANALAQLARQDVPDEVSDAYGTKLKFGPDYIIPTPYDPRLIVEIPKAVAQAAMDCGTARKPISDMAAYERALAARLDPTGAAMSSLYAKVRANPKRVVFAEGEEERVIRAAVAYYNAELGQPVLVGRETKIRETMDELGISAPFLEICNAARTRERNEVYADYLYTRKQRDGWLQRDAMRVVQTDRNFYAALMTACGDADAMVTGLTRSFKDCYDDVQSVFDARQEREVYGYNLFIGREQTVLIADTTIHPRPDAEQLAGIAQSMAARARTFGLTPRVAFLSYSTFGNAQSETTREAIKAVRLLDEQETDFEYEGELQADVALNADLMASRYPFCRLTAPANILIMPGLHASNISTKLIRIFGEGTMIGPVLHGLEKPVQILPMGSTVTDLVNAAVFGAIRAK